MAKKLLNEATIRRFQKLANVGGINESHDLFEAEEEEEGAPAMDAAMDAGMDDMPMDDEESEGGQELELTDEEAQAIIDLGNKLEAAMGGKEEEGEEGFAGDDMGGEDFAGDDMGEEELMEALRGISYVPSKQEVVNEVAKRVARRLQQAKLHEAKLNRALGKKKIDESREGDYKPALDHLNKERSVASFALQKASGDTTQAAQLCFAAHEMLTGKRFLPHMRDEAIAGLMRDAGLSESKVKTKKR